MIQLTQDELRRVQLIELEMLIEVDRICKKCDIHYNIIAGTLLGAVRHKGFIPWDDDADVALLRPEYEKFRKACETELDTERFYFQDYRNTKGYRWGYGKLRRKNTSFIREHQEHMPYESGIFIDIFPLDGVPDNYFLRCLHNFQCTCIRKILWSEVGRYAEANFGMRILFQCLQHISVNRVFDILNKVVCKSNKRETKYVRILTFPTPNRVYGYARKFYQESDVYIFENYQFQGIKDADAYLKFKFGDYMILPPIEKRKCHPIVFLQLTNPIIAKCNAQEKVQGGNE